MPSRAVRLAPLGLVEARVLERDRRVAGEHLEEPDVVFVELVDAELGDDDDADDARAVLSGTATIDSSMSSVPGIVTANSQSSALREQERLAGRGHAPVMPSPILHASASALSSA